MVNINNNKTRAEQLISENKKLKTRSDQLREKQAATGGVPEVTNRMARSVSDERRELMEMQLENGEFREQGSSGYSNSDQDSSNIIMKQTQAGVVSHNGRGLYKMANAGAVSSSGGSGWRGSNDSSRQIPEVYSPLWLNSNLNLPRDRATINAWSRSFFALNPIVHNAVTLHSTYPIAKLNIKSKNPRVEKFFSQMIEEIDLMNMCVLIAQEYWILGEAFVYAELDESKGSWSRLMILNPDYVNVQRSVIAAEPIVSLRPDENLRRVVFGNQPSDLQQRKQLDPSIVEHVRRNENIPLNNFYVSHIARRISPYEIRGTGLIVSCFRALMLWDKLRECYDEDTEILTRDGWKKITEYIEITDKTNINGQYVNGAALDENGKIAGVLSLKDLELACFNPETEEIEYHKPDEFHMNYYKGKMIHFSGKKVDSLVTPDHKMWVKKKNKNGYGDWKKTPAKDLLETKSWWKFRSHAKHHGEKIDTVDVCGTPIPAELYLKVLGYIISEGCVYQNYKNGRYDNLVILSQLTESKCFNEIKGSFYNFANLLDKNINEKFVVNGSGYSKGSDKTLWESRIHGKDLVNYLFDEIGDGDSANSHNKKIPRWVLDLCPEQLQIILEALLDGDGSRYESKYKTGSKSFVYNTVSKQLADDVYELVYKCGYVPNLNIHKSKKTDGREVVEYRVLWSDTEYGREPNIYSGEIEGNNGGGASVNEVYHEGLVWCFTVPTGLFLTRRNGKVTIQGNSKYAQADNMINPLTLVKVGDNEFRPTPVDLEHWRNVFEECYDEETEVLTDQGFQKFEDVIEYQAVRDGTTDVVHYNAAVKDSSTKIACFNPETEELEYHTPERAVVYDFDGDMYHFNNDKMDIKVTPNHDMWVQPKKFFGTGKERIWEWDDWKKISAEKLYKKPWDKRFRSEVKWNGKEIDYVTVCGKEVPIELYLEFLGYIISEGYLGNGNHEISLSQAIIVKNGTETNSYSKMRNCVEKIAKILGKKCAHDIYNSNNKDSKSLYWNARFYQKESKDLYTHLCNEIGSDTGHRSYDKIIPRWVLDLSPRLLKILLDALVLGDGSDYERKVNKSIHGYFYYTTSKQLADDVYEAVYKSGYVPTMFIRDDRNYMTTSLYPCYTVQWSNSNRGNFPFITSYSTDPRTKEKTDVISKEKYKGKVWCFNVPTGLFVTRRNGKITIQGNSQYDKDFKIFTHNAVNVERVGWGQGIYDTSTDVQQLIKEIYIGLMVPSVIMDGSDTTYATGSVALDVLRQRYMQFRQYITSWLKNRIFAPIAQINDFYEYVDGEKTLIVPEVDWNHMSLFDMDSYINNMVNLSQGDGTQKRVSLQTLYRSIGLEYDEENRKIKYEDIQNAIRMREMASMNRIPLSELRALGPGDEVPDVPDEPVPGESPLEPADQGQEGVPGGAGPGAPGGPMMPGAPPPAPIGGGGGAKPPGGGGAPPGMPPPAGPV